MTYNDKARIFRQLHLDSKILVLPNAWDVVSAKMFAGAGFPAIATTSAGIANCLGYRDGEQIPFDELLFMTRKIVNAVEVPVTADIESGYAASLDDVSQRISQIIDTGAVGINLEDSTRADELVATQFHVRKVELVRAAAEAIGAELFVNARTDVYLLAIGEEETRFDNAVTRARAYKAAGADCIFVPGVVDAETIRRLTGAISGPINILAVKGTPSVGELEQLGVSRVSTGSGPARACATLARNIGVELRTNGTYETYTTDVISYQDLNNCF
jgi:2-methylisocitrate lyase-like PEP mutase family enzyme